MGSAKKACRLFAVLENYLLYVRVIFSLFLAFRARIKEERNSLTCVCVCVCGLVVKHGDVYFGLAATMSGCEEIAPR